MSGSIIGRTEVNSKDLWNNGLLRVNIISPARMWWASDATPTRRCSHSMSYQLVPLDGGVRSINTNNKQCAQLRLVIATQTNASMVIVFSRRAWASEMQISQASAEDESVIRLTLSQKEEGKADQATKVLLRPPQKISPFWLGRSSFASPRSKMHHLKHLRHPIQMFPVHASIRQRTWMRCRERTNS